MLVPPAPGRGGPDLAALRALVVSQAPAHTVAEVRPGGLGLVVGVWSAVGVDTALVPLPAPYSAGTRPGAGQPVTLRPAQRGLAVGARIVGGHPAGIGPGRRHEHGGPVTDPVRGHAMTTGLSELPDFLRLSYFHGQMLAAGDFQREQAYFVEKLRLRNRCLHGYGVACGLQVSPVPSADPCEHRPRPASAAGDARIPAWPWTASATRS